MPIMARLLPIFILILRFKEGLTILTMLLLSGLVMAFHFLEVLKITIIRK
jgi:hypothetical protein